MPIATSPRKRALMPAGPLRRALRAAGHHLRPVVQVGKEGVTEPVLRQLSQALDDHELVKVRVATGSPEDRFEVADRLGPGAGAQVAQVLGRTVLVYRRRKEKPRFEPAAAEPAPASTSRAERGGEVRERPRPRPRARAGAGGRPPRRRSPGGR